MRMFRSIVLGLVIPGSLGLSAQAVPAGDSASVEAVEHLLLLTGAADMYRKMMDVALEGPASSVPTVAQDAETVRRFLEKYASYDHVKPGLMRLYRETFTRSEIEELVRFYSTHQGQEIVRKLALVTVRSAEVGRELIRPHLPELVAEIQNRPRVPPEPPAW